MNSQLLSMTALGPNDPDDGDQGRQMRGMAIAARVPIGKNPLGYTVPSQTLDGHDYVVSVGEGQFCSCPDFKKKAQPCKHLYAVEFTREREESTDGVQPVEQTQPVLWRPAEATNGIHPVAETRPVPIGRPKRVPMGKTSKAYNLAQINEEEMFGQLLRELCNTIVQPVQRGRGRRYLPLSDMVFAAGLKIYSMKSGRRAMTAMRNATERGQMEATPSFTSINRYLAKPELTPLLEALIEQSALPLRAIERKFATDSSGFSTATYDRWLETKWGKKKDKEETADEEETVEKEEGEWKQRSRWVTAHITCGVETNVVTEAEVTETRDHDINFFESLIRKTAENFEIQEVTGDKAYISQDNYHLIEELGGRAYIPFRKNMRPPLNVGEHDALWAKAYYFYHLYKDDFYARYHKRSNVETVFSMVKGKFGAAVLAKSVPAQINEVLLKFIAHNLCVLIHSIYVLGIEPFFADYFNTIDSPGELDLAG